ncbi:uncharacterized protein LOC119838885 [Zerene cesonia]|uniref:uncharacterized protein LOC119838885 n=1 Tax=Zerene cesonia TaxID=33412 RepID=UPI0018E5387E|nr:uncharacterized protein LOC119838885 [Zerene cesonia]
MERASLADSAYIVSGARDYARTAFKAAMASAQVVIQPVYKTMFSELRKFPRMQVVYHPNCRLPHHVDRSYGAYLQRVREVRNVPAPELAGKDRFKFCATPKKLLPVPSATPDFHPPTPSYGPAPSKPRNRGTQSLYRESSAQTVPWQPDAKQADTCEQKPEVLFLDNLQWGPGCPYRVGDLPADFHTTEIINKMRHARKWTELVEKGQFPRWMKKQDAIITDIETKDWIFREAEIDELQDIRLSLLHKLQSDKRQKQTTRVGKKLAKLWACKKTDMERKIDHIRRTRDRGVWSECVLGVDVLVAEIIPRILGVTQETVDVYLQEILQQGVELAAEEDAVSKAVADADRIEASLQEHGSMSTAEQNELVAELVQQFLLPEVHRSASRMRLAAVQQTRMDAARHSVFGMLDDAEIRSDICTRCGEPIGDTCRCAVCTYEHTPVATDARDDKRWKHTRITLSQAARPSVTKSRDARYPPSHDVRCWLNDLLDASRRHAEIVYDPTLLALEDHKIISEPPAWLDQCSQNLAKSCSGHHLPRDVTQLCERETKWSEQFLENLHNDLKKARLGAIGHSAGPLKVLKPRRIVETPRPPTPEVEAVPDDDEEAHQAALTLQRIVRGRAVQNLMYEGRSRAAELTEELKTTHGLQKEDRARIAREEARARDHNALRTEAEQKEDAITALVEELCGGAVSAALDFLEKELRRLKEERRHHAFILIASVVRSRERAGERSGVRREVGALLRLRAHVAVEVRETIDEMIAVATGEYTRPVKMSDYRHLMTRIVGDALGRSEPFKSKSLCPRELPSEIRQRAEEEAAKVDPACKCREVKQLKFDSEKSEEKSKLLPSELRVLEDMRRCKCDTEPSPSARTMESPTTEDFAYTDTTSAPTTDPDDDQII